MKKFFSILLALTMIFALSATAIAATVTPTVADADKKGSITIKGAQAGTNYNLYRVFDLTYAGSGENIAVAYTINSKWESFFATGSPGAEYIVDTNSGNLNPITVGNATKYINITDSNVVAFANNAKAWIDSLVSTIAADYSVTEVSENDEGENGFTVNVNTLGYYLIYPVGATQQNDSSSGSLCSLTSTTPNATIKVKAELPKITKTVDDNEVDVGQIVTFTITGEVPNVSGYTTYHYKVYDTFTNLKYASDFTITFGDGENAVTVTADIADQVTGIPAADATSFTLDIEMVAFLAAHNGVKAGDEITITYKAEVTDGALTSHEGSNKAHLEYSNDPRSNTSFAKTPDEEVKVYTCEVQVKKVQPDGETGLAGAKFVLYKKVTEENTEKTKYYKWNETDKKVEWVDDIANATVKTSDGTNNISFNGIESGTYWLHETEAPAGYNMLAQDIEVQVSNPPTEAGENPETNPTVVTVHVETVINQTGSELPSTGGIGRTIFYIIGAVLMIGAAVLLIVRKQMSALD